MTTFFLLFQSWPFYVFLISLCAFGIGSTPFYTLGTAYLHDNSPEEVVSVYVGILYAMGALGPAIGFLCGALFISFYEDPFNGPPKGNGCYSQCKWSLRDDRHSTHTGCLRLEDLLSPTNPNPRQTDWNMLETWTLTWRIFGTVQW